MWTQALNLLFGPRSSRMQTSEMEARLNFFFFFFSSLENITAITILWGSMIKCKLAYRLVLGGREKERWVKILKIM